MILGQLTMGARQAKNAPLGHAESEDIHSTAKNPALRKLTPICIILGVNRGYLLERRMDLPNFSAGKFQPSLLQITLKTQQIL